MFNAFGCVQSHQPLEQALYQGARIELSLGGWARPEELENPAGRRDLAQEKLGSPRDPGQRRASLKEQGSSGGSGRGWVTAPWDWLWLDSPDVDGDGPQEGVLQGPDPRGMDLKDFHGFIAA